MAGTTAGGSAGAGGTDVVLKPPSEVEAVELDIPEDLPGCEGPFPHDPAVDEATGAVYYAGSNENCIGEYLPDAADASIGEYRAWPTPTADAYPHGLVVAEGRVFYTGQDVNRIGRLDPTLAENAVVDFPVDATGPHSPVFHQGNIWFTAQQGGEYGFINLEGSESQVFSFTGGNTRPYGVWPAPDGSLWVALFGTNQIARIVTSGDTPMVEQVPLPEAGARPRRIAVDAAGRVWYTDYARSMLGLYDPSLTGDDRFAEYPTPGGGQPYGICIGPDGRVWYNDEDTPEMVGFDPETREVVAQLPLAPGSGPVRNISVDLVRNRIWLAISNVGRLGVIQF